MVCMTADIGTHTVVGDEDSIKGDDVAIFEVGLSPFPNMCIQKRIYT